MVRRRRPPSQTWKTFLENHVNSMVSVDFFTVPTIRFQILYVFLVLAHDRRRIVHFAVTAHPTAEWTAQQLREAFPWDTAPRYLLRDRDRIFGADFVEQVKAMGAPPELLPNQIVRAFYSHQQRPVCPPSHSISPCRMAAYDFAAAVRRSASKTVVALHQLPLPFAPNRRLPNFRERQHRVGRDRLARAEVEVVGHRFYVRRD
jgi:hypothetical protein